VRISVSDKNGLRQLEALFSIDPDAQVTKIAEDEIEVWYVGSRNAWAQVREMELRLRQWMSWNPDVIVAFTL